MQFNRRSRLFIDPNTKYCKLTRADWGGTVITAKEAILSVCMHLYGLCLCSKQLRPMIAFTNLSNTVSMVTKRLMIRKYKPSFLVSVSMSPDPDWTGCQAYYFWRSQSSLVLATRIIDTISSTGLVTMKEPAVLADNRSQILTRSPCIGVIIILGSITTDSIFADEEARIRLARSLKDGIVQARAALPAQHRYRMGFIPQRGQPPGRWSDDCLPNFPPSETAIR